MRALLAALLLPVAAAAQTPITLDRAIQGGGTFGSELAGITFDLPAGFQGGWDAEASGVVLQSPQGMILGVWGWSEGEVQEVAAALDQRLSGLGLQLQATGQPVLTETELTGTFSAYSSEGSGVLAAGIRRGPEGNVFAVAVLGGPDARTTVEGMRDDVIASLDFTTPLAATWRAEVEGSVLRWSSSGSDMSTGTTTATGASQSDASIALCPGGVYQYVESSETYISIEGMSASNSSEDGHRGQWWITADLAGQALLTLEATDGRVFYWPVEESGDGVLIDGYRYQLTGSC